MIIRTIDGIAVPEGVHTPIAEGIEERRYERHQLGLVNAYVQPHHRVLEGGSGLGVVTRVLTERAECVVSCEVSFDLLECARSNAPDALFVRYRLGVDTLRPPDTGDGFGVPQSPEIASVNPDVLIRAYGLNALVLDVEGDEAQILRNIELGSLELVIAELHPPLYDARVMDEAKEKLNAVGFVLAEEMEDGPLRHVAYLKN